MDDIVERLKAAHSEVSGGEWPELEEAADEIERLRAMVEWRPIETAPRNGTPVDVWSGNAEYPRRSCDVVFREPTESEFWSQGSSEPDENEGTIGTGKYWFDNTFGFPLIGDDAPTHWCLPPEPPKGEE